MRTACFLSLFAICHLSTNATANDQEDLVPAPGTVTFAFTYFPQPLDADKGEAPKQETRSVTVPINFIDKQGSKTVRFGDIDCIVSYGVDMSIVDIYSRNPSRSLFRRMHSSAQNGSDNGIMGKNKVYHPTTGSCVEFTAFSGTSAADTGEPADKPKINIADLNLAKTIDSFARDELEAARKHANYGVFGQCDRIVIGRLSVHEMMVLESDPPIYQYDLHILLDGIIKGPKTKAGHIEAGYSQSEGALPTFDKDVVCVVGLAGNSLQTWTPADQAVVNTAIVATLDQDQAKRDDWSVAKNQPEQHEHFDFFRNSKSLALVRLHGSAHSVVFTTATKLESMKYKIVHNYRGSLSSGDQVALSAKSSVRELSFVSYEKRGNDWVITESVAVSPSALLVAAKALGTSAESLKERIAADKLEFKKEEARYAKQLEGGPEHGHSQSSQGFDPTEDHTHGSDTPGRNGTRDDRPE
ncbi:hypothetical protein [Neorhodopirellula pilleata]|uniref:SLA1 homology domain-containing protein n=1 Tax=Neorhodopirellula pilleata TaxID=2714738 RepID=A0A5C5ZK94_9BACT|nr:hypothetical protein [Neorhodopirellula pilleata]TWT87839.1 hypothetical protein Pla100_58780 [Neorhodopirellula pilleata]